MYNTSIVSTYGIIYALCCVVTTQLSLKDNSVNKTAFYNSSLHVST